MAYQKPTPEQAELLYKVGYEFDLIRQNIEVNKLKGRRVSIALTHLEAAEMFLNKAIVKGDD